MTKAEVIKAMQKKMGGDFTQGRAGEALEAALAVIAEALQSGKSVNLAGLGTFSVGQRAARQGRNPRTGAKISIPASKAVKFRAAKSLKEAVK